MQNASPAPANHQPHDCHSHFLFSSSHHLHLFSFLCIISSPPPSSERSITVTSAFLDRHPHHLWNCSLLTRSAASPPFSSTESIIISLPFLFLSTVTINHQDHSLHLDRLAPPLFCVEESTLSVCYWHHRRLSRPSPPLSISPSICPVLLIVNNTRSSTSTCFSRPEPEQSLPVTLSSQSPSLASLVDRLPLHHHLQSSLLLCGC